MSAVDDISSQMRLMQEELTSALDSEKVARAALVEASSEFESQKKDMWDATGHYIRVQKRKVKLSEALRERESETNRVAERTREVLDENGDLQRELDALVREEEENATLFVRHLLGLRQVVKNYQRDYDKTLER
jgi:RNA binding exosome subunit